MRIVIQRPRERWTPDERAYVNTVFEAVLEPLAAQDVGTAGWYRLVSLQPSREAPAPGLPYLHKGYFDSHLHVTGMGLFDEVLDLQGAASADEILARVEKAVREARPGSRLLRAFGWNEGRLGLTLEDLPRAFENKLPEALPLMLTRICGHSALVNKAFRNAYRERVPGLGREGVFITDQMLASVQEHLPQPSQDECEAAFLRAQRRLLDAGISAVGDMSLDETMIAALGALAQQGKLRIDVEGMFDAGRAPSVETQGPLLVEAGATSEYIGRPARLSVRHWKRYLDGSLGSRTAWLSQSYADRASIGDKLQDASTLQEEALAALNAGFYLSFHAIGDAALDQALDLADRLYTPMQARLNTEGKGGFFRPLHRIEHAQVIRDEQLDRLRAQGFWTLCVQPHHRVADESFAVERLGAERFRTQAYRAARLLRSGVALALGSDAPIDSFRPEDVIAAACSHPNAAESLSFDEALWQYTTGSRLHLGLNPGVISDDTVVWLTPGESSSRSPQRGS